MASLYLSHWNDTEKVYVPADIVRNLKSYQISMVRFLYRCFNKKYNGAILNCDDGINMPLGIQGLLHALINGKKLKSPVLIISSDEKMAMWHYHMSQLGVVFVLTGENCEEIFCSDAFSIMLIAESNLRLLQPYREERFSLIIAEDFDFLATKIIFRKLSGEFNIALTKKDFMNDRDYKIMWNILNWVNPGEYGKLNDFSNFDQDHLKNLRNPYDDIWYKVHWNRSECGLERIKTEEEEYKNTVKDWAAQNGLPYNSSSPKALPSKRKRGPVNNHNSKVRKRPTMPNETDDIKNEAYHLQETQLVGQQESQATHQHDKKGVSANSREGVNFAKVNKLRDVSVLNYSYVKRADQPQIVPQECIEKPQFKPAFIRTKTLNRGPFGSVDIEKSPKEDLMIQCNKNKSPITGDASVISRETTSYFPSLEDIFTFKRSIPPPRLKVMEHLKEKEAKLENKEEKTKRIEPKNLFSLEEIFNGKRKLFDSPKQSKKLNTNSPYTANRRLAAVSDKGTELSSEISLKSKYLNEKSCSIITSPVQKNILYNNDNFNSTTLLRNKESPSNSFNNNEPRLKYIDNHKITYKNIGKNKKNVQKNVEKVCKETQTCSDVILPSDIISICKDSKNITINIYQVDKNRNINKKVVKINDEVDFIGGNNDNAVSTNNQTHQTININNENQTEKAYVGTEKTDWKDKGNNELDIEEPVVSKKENVINETEHSSKNSNNIETETIIKEDEGNVILSIMEGKYSSQSMIKQEKKDSIDGEKNSNSSMKRQDSKSLLESLFGVQSEYLEDGSDGTLSRDSDVNSETSTISQLKTESQSQFNLKVKSIDQINGEDNSQNSESIYNSLRILFDNEETSNFLDKSKFRRKKSVGRKNLFSSLFS